MGQTRRSLMKALGMAPIGLGSAKAEIAGLIASPAVTAFASATMPQTAAQSLLGKFGPLLGSQIDALSRNYQAESELRRFSRAPGEVDPDIQCLRSVATVHKRRKQLERDLEDNLLNRKINDLMWGNPS